MAKDEIIWDEAPATKNEIVWDEPSNKSEEIVWDKPEKSTLQKISDVAVEVFKAPSNLTSGFYSGFIKFDSLGKTVKGQGDMYLEKANALNKEIDTDISNRKMDFTFRDIENGVSNKSPDVKKLLNDRFEFQKNIELLNKSMNESQDPVAKQEIANQINKASMDVTNIDKIISPAWKNPNEYKNLIDKFNQQRTLTEKANKAFQMGKNLQSKHERVLNSFTTADERDTFAYKLGHGIESMVEAVAVSKGTGVVGTAMKLAPGAINVATQVVPGVALALPGAIDMYDKAIGKGVDPKTARMIAAGDLFANAALESMSFGFIFKGPAKGFIKSAITEGSQELAQTFTDNAITKAWIDKNQNLFEGALESFAIGGIIGGSVGKIRAQAEIPIMENVKMRIKNNPKYQESFKAANMNEQDIDQLLDRVAKKTSEINEVVSEKTFTDEFNKTMGDLGKDQPEDAMRRKPIEGELDLNNPLQIEQAIADLNRIISENEGNPNVTAEIVDVAIKKRNSLAEKFHEVTNRPNMELNPAEITQIQADIKESTGAEITPEQAAAIMREMSDKRVEQIKYQDESVRDTGKTIQIRDEQGELQGVTGIKSQRRPELVGTTRGKIPQATMQQAADTDLINGYVEGGTRVPGDTEYIYAKAVAEKSPELMQKVVDTAPAHVKFVLEGNPIGAKNIEELKSYFGTLEAQVQADNTQEVKDEYERVKGDIQEIERITKRAESAAQSLGQKTKESKGATTDRAAKDVNDNSRGFAKVAGEKGGKGAKRLDWGIISDFSKALGFDIVAVKGLGKGAGGGEIKGMAFPEYGQAKLVRALFKGEWGLVTKEMVGEREFQVLKDAEIINENGAVDITKYNGKLGHLKAVLDGVLQPGEIEALQSKLLEAKNTEELSEVMAHEIGHNISGAPDGGIDRGNLIGHILSEIKSRQNEDIRIIGTNSEIRKELISLAEWWSPYNKETASQSFIKYRNSADELYADALSVYINDPKVAKERAPIFFQNFEKHLFKKPGVSETFAHLDKLRNADEKTLQAYYMQKGTESAMRAENFMAKAYELKSKKDIDIIEKIKDAAMSEIAIGDLQIRKLAKKYGYLTDLTDLETVAGQAGKIDFLNLSIRKGWISEPKRLVKEYRAIFGDKFIEFVDPSSKFGRYMVVQRIINDRSGLANPQSVKAAKSELQGIKDSLTPEQFAEYELYADKYYSFMDTFLRKQVSYGLMSKEHYAKIKENNTKYAFFHVAENEFHKANSAFGNTTPANVKSQTGTLKDVRNPVTSTVDLLNKMGWMMEVSKFKLEFVNFMKLMPAQEDVIREVHPGKFGQMPKPDKGYLRLDVLDNSEYKSYDVRKDLYEEMDFTIAQLDKIPWALNMIRYPSTWIKMGLTKFNIGFTAKNPIRDYLDVKLVLDAGIVPGVSSKDLAAYTKNLKDAYAIAFKAVMNPESRAEILNEAENMGAIIPRDLKFKIDEASSAMSMKTEEILNSIGVQIAALNQNKSGLKPENNNEIIKKALLSLPKGYDHLMTNINEISENATKLAFYQLLKDKGLAPERAAVYTRRFAGTPDPTYGGKHRMALGTFFAFFNPTIQGNMRMVHALTKTGGLTGKARAAYIGQVGVKMMLQPEMLLVFLAWGLKNLWDDDPEKNPMLRVSDNTIKRYFVIPAFGREWRIPRGQMNAVMTQITWDVLDTLYSTLKLEGNNAQKNMKEFLGTIFMLGGISDDTVTPVLKTILEVKANRDWLNREIYDPNNSEAVKSKLALKHILGNTILAPIPKSWTLGFVNKYTGDTERLAKNGESFRINRADMLTEMANIYEGKGVNANRLRKLAGDEPVLIGMAEKAIALSADREGVMKVLRQGNAWSYAKAILNIAQGKDGLEGGLEKMSAVIDEASRVLSDEEFGVVWEFYGMFGK